MKSVYLFGISIAIGLVIVYLQWQQNKKLEEMKQMLLNVSPATKSVDNNFILEQNERLHAKIESAYDKVHQQYEQILIAVDNLYETDESMEEESMPSYHVEQLINIDKDFNLSNEKLEHIMESQHQETTYNNMSSVKTPMSKSSQKGEEVSLIKDNLPAAVDENLISTQSNITANGGLYPKIAELKNLCREKALPVSGNKNELVQRLLDNGHIFEN